MAIIDNIRELSKVLDVYKNNKIVGHLTTNYQGVVVFKYAENAKAEDIISSTMTDLNAEYAANLEDPKNPNRGMLSFFQMNLAEGDNQDPLADLIGPSNISDPMCKLAVTGYQAIGDVKVVPHGYPLDWLQYIEMSTEEIIGADDSEKMFKSLSKNLHVTQGVAGAMPKALVALASEESSRTFISKKIIFKIDHINYQGLSINEDISMKMAKRLGFDVAETHLTKDGKGLVVERFDIDSDGKFIHFEDFCALTLKDSIGEGKYTGSMELALKTLRQVMMAYNHTDGEIREAQKQLVKLTMMNMAVGNTDAHFKNIGILVKNGKVQLSPTYDIVAVTAFNPHDKMALSVCGSKDTTFSKNFLRWVIESARMSRQDIEQYRDQLIAEIRTSQQDVLKYMEQYPHFRELGKKMIHEWDKSIKRLEVLENVRELKLPTEKESMALYKLSEIRKQEKQPKKPSWY